MDKMDFKRLLILCGCLGLVSFSFPKNIQKKVNKEVKTVFEIEQFTLEEFIIEEGIHTQLPAKFGDNNFFKIISAENQMGYAYIAKAPSKTDYFDYLVILDNELIIRASKILAYREDYGGEIGSKRWLRQLIGKTSDDELIYGDNIAAISGATISVRSMTNAINNLLLSIKSLQEKEILP